jgi:hypothetical protein
MTFYDFYTNNVGKDFIETIEPQNSLTNNVGKEDFIEDPSDRLWRSVRANAVSAYQ